MPLPKRQLAGGTAVCASCLAENTLRVFPAALAEERAAVPAAASAGEAACFDHPNKLAVAACSQCGRFVCQLCEVQFGDETWCPSCVAAGSGKARAANTETSRTLYDSIALTLPLASLILWPFTALAGPAAVVLSIMKWKAPLSLVRRSRWRFVVGILLGLAETGGWIWGILYLSARMKMGGR